MTAAATIFTSSKTFTVEFQTLWILTRASLLFSGHRLLLLMQMTWTGWMIFLDQISIWINWCVQQRSTVLSCNMLTVLREIVIKSTRCLHFWVVVYWVYLKTSKTDALSFCWNIIYQNTWICGEILTLYIQMTRVSWRIFAQTRYNLKCLFDFATTRALLHWPLRFSILIA